MKHNNTARRGAFIVFFVTYALLSSTFSAAQVPGTPDKGIRYLGNLLETGYILQDRNDDDVVDFVNVRIILPDAPSEAEIVSAANIAARLGYETSAVNLDFIGYDSENRDYYDLPVILIGARNDLRNRIGGNTSGIDRQLIPGQGDIFVIQPDDFFRDGGFMITGSDATGLIAAADYLAGRYPDIWKLKGKTYEDVQEQFSEFFEQRDLTVDEIFPHRIVVDSEKPGTVKLSMKISVPDIETFTAAANALKGKDAKTEEETKKLKLSDLEFVDLHRIEVNLTCPDSSLIINLLPRKPWQTKAADARSSAASPDFTLSKFYTINGIFRDTNQDFVPDNTAAYFSLNGTEAPDGVINLAVRTGLESAGIRLPLVQAGGEEDYPEQFGFPIIYGINHYQIANLKRKQKLYGVSDEPGEGYVQFAAGAFNNKNGLAMSGSDEAGLKAISDYAAKRMPYLWDYGKGNYSLEDVETYVRKFFQVREAPGQAVLATYKLKSWLQRIKDKDIESVDVEIAVKENPNGLDMYAEKLVKEHFPLAKTSAKTYTTGFGVGKTIFEEQFEIPWEVDEFWRLFRDEVLPKITPDAPSTRGKITVRISESPETRAQLKSQIENELSIYGINNSAVEVVVLCAYKQGYSWLYDEILPKIKDKNVGAINIKYHTLKDSKEVRWQTVHANTRWLQEIFPIDDILARELDIPDSLITFTPTQQKEPIYTVHVTDKTGGLILEESFNPKYVVRPFFDLFPEYESLRVTTGWVSVEINGQTLLDKRIKTDPETFWDHLQTTTFRKIVDYVMDVQEGRPSSENAPYFDEFRVVLTLSEPNYRLGIDEEVISSTEALHEDILFHTLALFNRIGGRYSAGSMSSPGRILPYLQPPRNGRPGTAEITFTGKERASPELIMTYKEKGREPVKQRYPLSTLNVSEPKLRGISVKSGEEGITQLLFEVEATDSTDRYEEFKKRSSEAAIDRSFISAEKLVDMVKILGELHNEGIFEDALSYDRVEEMLFRVTLVDSADFTRLVSLKRSNHPKSTNNPELDDRQFRYYGQQIVQWDTPINPAEAADIMAKLNTFPNVNAYYMATSFLGQDVFAVDLLPKMDAQFVSQAKLNALKPTLFLFGRTHGNEVSSTGSILRLAELAATDSTYTNYLKNVNVVLYPINNPDGAQLAYEMYKVNPDFMLHAGRSGALGADVGSGSSRDSRYPEAGIVYRIREAWLPDIVINMHGVPTHEWVQYFAGYSAWVRNRSGGTRSYWLPRGWYVPGFSWIEDDRHPDLERAQKAIIDSIVTAVTSQPEVEAMNNRFYKRYIKYRKQDEETYTEYFYKGIQIEAGLRSRRISGSGITGPQITYFSITTETADETARGDWMKLVCTAGLAHNTVLLKYLNDGVNEITHDAKEFDNFVTRSVYRIKPVVPKSDKKKKKESK